MTIQNWTLTPERASIVCDSLGSSANDQSAGGMVSKCLMIPHLSILVAVKNWMTPALGLYLHLGHACVAHNWQDVVSVAPEILRKTAHSDVHCAEHMATSRVVVFGHDEVAGCIAGCIFQGSLNFKAEPCNSLEWYMPRIHPMPRDDWDIALAQQAFDCSLALKDRDNIGGPVIRAELVLLGGAPHITVSYLGTLPNAAVVNLGHGQHQLREGSGLG